VHTYRMAELRLVLGAEVQAGNEAASSYAQPGFREYFDALPASSRPVFVRGDMGWGTERMMQEAEQRDQAYLFKIRQSVTIKELLAGNCAMDQWEGAGQGWEGCWSTVRLAGWTARRRVMILRRPLREDTRCWRPTGRKTFSLWRNTTGTVAMRRTLSMNGRTNGAGWGTQRMITRAVR